MYALGLLCFLDELTPLLLLMQEKSFSTLGEWWWVNYIITSSTWRAITWKRHYGHYRDFWLEGSQLTDKGKQIWIWSKKRTLQYSPNMEWLAALDSSEFPVSGCK